MIELWIAIGTVEWCVIGFIAAMAVLAVALRPAERHEVMTLFFTGVAESDVDSTPPDEPTLEVYVADKGISITRVGFDGLLRTDGGMVALAVTVSGNDITIKERITFGRGEEFCGKVCFDISRLGVRGNCHVQYVSDDLSRATAFSLLLRPGVKVFRKLRR